ncbi:MAG: type II secretion system protein GspF [Lysobacterales bacterium CG02_land_8_20_14_3_00_62_12]|nr:MAG: type II secretion system protein GspF [Xanthomonadales bacterium CG02_land_8_20_14_3_00_62_12]
MGAYAWQALDQEGRTQTGVVQAETPRAARGLLRERGLSPLQVSAVAEAAKVGAGAPWFGRRGLSSVQLVVLTQQLSTLIRAGLPIDEALAALADEASDQRLRGIVAALRSRVMEGSTLAASMALFPESFPELVSATVQAGEQSGELAEALERLAEYAEARDNLSRELIAAFAYPALLLLVALAVVTGLMTSVVPRVVEVFVNMGAELPWLTQVLIAVSHFLSRFGGWLLLLLLAAGVAWRWALRHPDNRRWSDAQWLKLPLLGRVLRAADTARVTRTLAVLTSAGVPVLDALRLATVTLQRLPLQDAMRRAAERVREGTAIARALAETGAFPPVALRLIASGERSGRLAQMFDAAAIQQGREVKTALDIVRAVLAPLVILVVGALVLAIVLAILLPIFELNTLIGTP